jgi:hypothetical protein
VAQDAALRTVPAGGDHPARSDLLKLSLSIRDAIPIADAAGRATRLAALLAASPSVTPSTSNPIFFYQEDLPSAHRVIWTVDGDNFISTSGHYVWEDATERGAATGMANGDFGFQTDTKATYARISGAWVLWDLDWTAYTPTLTNVTLGAGTFSNTRYRVVNGVVQAHGKFTLGSGSAIGAGAGITHPAGLTTTGVGGLGFFPLGAIVSVIAGTARLGLVVPASGAAGSFYSASTTLTSFNAAAPAAWGTNDSIMWNYSFPLV